MMTYTAPQMEVLALHHDDVIVTFGADNDADNDIDFGEIGRIHPEQVTPEA